MANPVGGDSDVGLNVSADNICDQENDVHNKGIGDLSLRRARFIEHVKATRNLRDEGKNLRDERKNLRDERKNLRDGGSSSSESCSYSSSSAEDETGIELTPKVEKDFFRMLACIKGDDSCVYDKNHKFFSERDEAAVARVKVEKPLFLRDLERTLILKYGAEELQSDEEKRDVGDQPSQAQLTREEKCNLLESFRKAVDSSSDSEGLFVPRKPEPEVVKKFEDGSYKAWLLGQGELGNEQELKEEELKPLKECWTDPKLAEEEAFLKNYILGKPYAGLEDLSRKEHVTDNPQTINRENLERKFNYRFEEPGGTVIQTYPHKMVNSVRARNTHKADLKKARNERRKQRREARMQELVRLKAEKRKEIRQRVEALTKATGNKSLAFEDFDGENNFDLAKHDQLLQAINSDPFYENDENKEKPEFSDLENESDPENLDNFDGNHRGSQSSDMDEEGFHCEDDDFNMDADYDPATAPAKSKDKKKSKQKEPEMWAVFKKPRPAFDPTKSTFDAYIDEYYQMDFEDIIGDMPCRFKYRQVEPNSFGLTVEEILLADDKELEKWVPLARAIGHRSQHVENMDKIHYQNRARNEYYKSKILPSLYKYSDDEELEEEQQQSGVKSGAEKKRKKAGGKKKRRGDGLEGIENDCEANKKETKDSKEVQTNLAMKSGAGENELDHSSERRVAKEKKRKKELSENNFAAEEEIEQTGVENELQNGEAKKKKNNRREISENNWDAEEGFEQAGVESEHQNEESRKKKKYRKEQEQPETMSRVPYAEVETEAMGTKKRKKNKQHEVAENDEAMSRVPYAEVETEAMGTKERKKNKQHEVAVNEEAMSRVPCAEVETEAKGTKERKKNKQHEVAENDEAMSRVPYAEVETEAMGTKKRKKNKQHEVAENDEGMSRVPYAEMETEAMGTIERKKNKQHEVAENDEGMSRVPYAEVETEAMGTKKRKKNKQYEVAENDEGMSRVPYAEVETEAMGTKKRKKNKPHELAENDEAMSRVPYAEVETEAMGTKKRKKNKQHEVAENDEAMSRVPYAEVEAEAMGTKERKKNKPHELATNDEAMSKVPFAEVETEAMGTIERKKNKPHELATNDEAMSKVPFAEVETEAMGTIERKKNKQHEVAVNEETAVECSPKQGEAKKIKCEGKVVEEDNDAAKSGLSRRKLKNLKLMKKRELGEAIPRKKKKKNKKSKPRNCEWSFKAGTSAAGAYASPTATRVLPTETRAPTCAAQASATATQVVDQFSEKRLEAYGLPRPKRFLDYLKYKDKDAKKQDC